MRFLLRSCFIALPSDDPELSFRNYLALSESGLGFDVPEDTVLWEFVRDFARTHNHVPDVRTIRSHFETLKNPEAGDRLEVLAPLKPLFKGDFIKRLEERAEERRSRMVVDILREASQILQTGIEVKEGKKSRHLRGPVDAVRYLVNKSHDIVMPTTGARLSGEITLDGESFKQEYEKVESDPTSTRARSREQTEMNKATRVLKERKSQLANWQRRVTHLEDKVEKLQRETVSRAPV